MPAQNLPGLLLDRAHPLSRGLVGWWPMNEGGGERVGCLVPGAFPGAFSGISPSATSGWTGGMGGAAVRFDGSNDAVVVPTSPSIAITADITVSGWVNIPALSSYYVMAEKGASYPNPYAIVVEPGGTVEWLRGNGAAQSYVISTGAISAGRWQFLAGTWAAGVFKIYLNGRLDNTASSSPACTDDGLSLYIGKRRDAAAPMPGAISHVRIYNRALLPAEVAQLYADPLAGALAPSRLTRLYTVPVASPPAAATGPLSSDRLYNRSLSRIYRRGETG